MPKDEANISWHTADRPHTQIHRLCGACHHPFRDRERMLAITRRNGKFHIDDAQTATSQRFAKQWYKVAANFCKKPGCRQCQVNDESATLHIDCFKLYMRECRAKDRVHRLWLASTAMLPWRQCPETVLPYDFTSLTLPQHAYRAWQMPLVKRLPLEICHMILSYTRHHISSRFIAVLARISELKTLPPPDVPVVNVPLKDVVRWKRGMYWPIQTKQKEEKYMRITIDSSGILQIDRFTEDDEDDPVSSTYLRRQYVVEEVSKLGSIEAHITSGHCRLTVPDDIKLTLWDNPMPMKFYHHLRLPEKHDYNRFTGIDTRRCFGITFFFVFGYIIATHVHHSNEWDRDAQRTFDCLPLVDQEAAIWIYVPLPRCEEIRGFAVRPHDNPMDSEVCGPCLVFNMKQQGYLQIGYHQNLEFEYEMWRTPPRPMLAHNVRASYLTPHEHLGEKEHLAGLAVAAPFPAHAFTKRTIPYSPPTANYRYQCYSSASLEKVTAVTIFYDHDSEICRGLLLKYRSGKKKALGECRLGVNRCKHVERPTHFCWATTIFPHPADRREVDGALVEVVHRPRQRQPFGINDRIPGWPWRCNMMTGKVIFIYGYRTSTVRVENRPDPNQQS